MAQLLNNLEQLGENQKKVEHRALRAGAKPIQKIAYEKAPVDTGQGRETIKIGTVKTRKSGKHITVGIHKQDHAEGKHMYYQEFGTSHHPAQPFLRPAFIEEKENAVKEMGAEIKKGLDL